MSKFEEYVIKAKRKPLGQHIGSEQLKPGQHVQFFKIEGDHTDWGCSPKEFEQIKAHRNQEATVKLINGYYVDLEFDDGFILKAVNDHQVKKI